MFENCMVFCVLFLNYLWLTNVLKADLFLLVKPQTTAPLLVLSKNYTEVKADFFLMHIKHWHNLLLTAMSSDNI